MPIDALLLTVLVGTYLGMRSIIPLPQVVPGHFGLSGLAVLAAGLYWLVSLLPMPPRQANRAKWMLAAVVIGLIPVASTLAAVAWRLENAQHEFVHDGLIQSEAAVDLVAAGLNPYGADYRHTAMADWPYRVGSQTLNPALFHYPYLPATFLIPLPFQLGLQDAWGWFDQRLVYLIAFLGLLLSAGRLTADPLRRMSLVIFLGLSPTFVPYLIEGRNEVLVLFWITLAAAMLRSGHRTAAAVTFGLACATKQTAWFLIPFFFLYLAGDGSWKERWGRVRKPAVGFLIAFGALIFPWLISDPVAFFEDIFLFQSGLLPEGYPINGFGFSAILLSFGLLDAPQASFPFWIFSAGIGLMTAALLLRWQIRRNRLDVALLAGGLLSWVMLFFGRAFNDNYLGFISGILAIGVTLAFRREFEKAG